LLLDRGNLSVKLGHKLASNLTGAPASLGSAIETADRQQPGIDSRWKHAHARPQRRRDETPTDCQRIADELASNPSAIRLLPACNLAILSTGSMGGIYAPKSAAAASEFRQPSRGPGQ
jgi:hypothetical protein